MKLKVALLSTLVAFLMTGALFAAENTKSLTINTPVQVNGTVLKPGDYKVSWEGTGPAVTVKFVKGKETVATAPAKLDAVKSEQTSVQMNNAGSSPVLQKINFPKVALDFSQGGSASGR